LTTDDAVAPARRGRLWRHRDFLLLWVGESVSDVGTAVSGVVVPLVAVVGLRASAVEVGVLAAAQWLPWLLIGLPAGAWVDRIRCRLLMVVCDVVRAVALGSIPVAAAMGVLTIGQLLVVGLITGVATVFFQVAYQSYLPSLVERSELAEGNAKLQGTQSVATVAGPGVGGLLAQLFQAAFALIVDAVSYLVSAVALLAIRAREPERAPVVQRNLRREIGEGLRFVAADPLLRVLTIAPAVSNLAFTGFEVLYVLFLVREVGLAAGAVGLLIGLAGLGGVVGAVLARPVARWIGSSRAIWVVTLGTAPFGLLVPLTTSGAGVLFFLVGNVVVYGGVLVYNITVVSFRQSYCPPAILGRVTATMRFVLFGTIPVGALAGGFLAGALGSRPALWVLFGAYLLPGLILAASPLRGMRDLPDSPPAALTAAPPGP